MAASRDRWERVKSSLEPFGMPVERIDAVVGANLCNAEISRFYNRVKNFFFYTRFLSKGEIGCYLSHKKVWQKILNDGVDFGIVIEDDIEALPEFAQVPALLENIKEPFDYAKLISPGRSKKIIRETPIGNFRIVRWLKPPTYAAAQAIKPSGARKLLDVRKIFFRPVDVDIQYFWETRLNIIGIYPEPFKFNDTSKQSTIASTGRKNAKRTFPFARLANEIVYYVKSIFYKRKTF